MTSKLKKETVVRQGAKGTQVGLKVVVEKAKRTGVASAVLAEKARRKSLGQRGKKAEDVVESILEELNTRHLRFAYERLPDARAAGGRLKAQLCDYLIWINLQGAYSIQLEVKETEHPCRLEKAKVGQLSRMRKVAAAGGFGFVLTHHSTLRQWRIAPLKFFDGPIPASWDLTPLPLFDSAEAAMRSVGIFGL